MSSYFVERDKKNLNEIKKYQKKLPSFCQNFFLDKETTSSTSTRLAMAIDLSVFFDFIKKYKFAGTKVENISYQQMSKIESDDISSFLSYISYYEHNGKNYKNSNNGKSRKLASIRSLFKWLYRKNYVQSDVAAKIDTPKKHEKPIVRLEADEVAKIINTTEDGSLEMSKRQAKYLQNTSKRDTAILTLFLSTGIRVSECVGLDLDDFDFDNNAFKITRKGGNQTILYFAEETKQALLDWLEVRQNSMLPEEETAMFTSLQKKRLTVRAVEYIVKKYAKFVNPLKKISPHKLRSTFGTNLYRGTGDIYIVADVLGHKDINVTKRHYAAIAEDSKRTAASIIKLRDKK